MREINFSADALINALLKLENGRKVCILDSCGVNHLDSHLLIAGINPVETLQITNDDPNKTLRILDAKLSNVNLSGIFTISYNFGLKLENIKPREKEIKTFPEPDIYLALFDCLIIHDYYTGKTFLTGNVKRFDEIEKLLSNQTNAFDGGVNFSSEIFSNFTRENYIGTIEKIQDYIRRGATYQTNLTRQFRARLPENLTPQKIFYLLRKSHPAPFAAFITRHNDCVVSISPERFFRVQDSRFEVQGLSISASPIKGTRRRGIDAAEDLQLRNELLESGKDRAENVMIVDLLRNDIGRICEFGSVEVEKLCELEEHPTLFHLVSTVRGKLRENLNLSDIIKSVFPCGSITGAPKINTMRIIDELETVDRGLSMGAIGCSIPDLRFKVQSSRFKVQGSRLQVQGSKTLDSRPSTLDLSVAIRTMVIRENEAVFNVGGGIVIDSIPEDEYEETLIKAKAMFNAINGKLKQI